MFYGAGASANAAKIAGYFGGTATALPTLPAGHVEILLGTGSTIVPASGGGLHRPRRPRPARLGRDNGAAGTAVTVSANAKYGIPCVY